MKIGHLAGLCAALLVASPCYSAAPPPVDVRRDATVEAVQRVMPTVVNIRTETVVERNDPFERFMQEYYRRRPSTETTYSLGSGVIIDEDGWVLTNFHVINRATRVFIRLSDGREYEADRIVGTSFTDLALVRIVNPKREKFQVIKFAADDDLLLGETVIALGNPFGLGGSVSKGILSSKSRRPPLENEPLEIEDWLQTDAAINPGNSGGPLVNLRGELIGISVAVYREGQGIGFAVPIRRVSAAISEIYSPEILESYWFGARVRPGVSPLTVSAIQPESPAAKAGLQSNDRILHVNGVPPHSYIDFIRRIVDMGTNRPASVTVQRGSERRVLNLRLMPEISFFNPDLIRRKLGVMVEELTPRQSHTIGLEGKRGLLVVEVERNSPAEKAGLRENMIISAADGQASWYAETQKAPPAVPIARVLHGKKRGEKVTLDLFLPRRTGRVLHLQSAKVDVPVR